MTDDHTRATPGSISPQESLARCREGWAGRTQDELIIIAHDAMRLLYQVGVGAEHDANALRGEAGEHLISTPKNRLFNAMASRQDALRDRVMRHIERAEAKEFVALAEPDEVTAALRESFEGAAGPDLDAAAREYQDRGFIVNRRLTGDGRPYLHVALPDQAAPPPGSADPEPAPTVAGLTRRVEHLQTIVAATENGETVALARDLISHLEELMSESAGVAGLHRNGDLAPWDSLIEGGDFDEWLSSFNALRDHLAGLPDDRPAGFNPASGAEYDGMDDDDVEEATADPEALAWLESYDPGDMGGPCGETEATDQFTRAVVLDAYVAGRDASATVVDITDKIVRGPLPDDPEAVAWLKNMIVKGDPDTLKNRELILMAYAAGRDLWRDRMGAARVLLTDGAELLRGYEAHDRGRAGRIANGTAPWRDSTEKAEVNAAMAERFEAWLRFEHVETIRDAQAAFIAANPGPNILFEARFDPPADDPARDVFGYLDPVPVPPTIAEDIAATLVPVPIIEEECSTWSIDDPTAKTIAEWLRTPTAAHIVRTSVMADPGLLIHKADDVAAILRHVAAAIVSEEVT